MNENKIAVYLRLQTLGGKSTCTLSTSCYKLNYAIRVQFVTNDLFVYVIGFTSRKSKDKTD